MSPPAPPARPTTATTEWLLLCVAATHCLAITRCRVTARHHAAAHDGTTTAATGALLLRITTARYCCSSLLRRWLCSYDDSCDFREGAGFIPVCNRVIRDEFEKRLLVKPTHLSFRLQRASARCHCAFARQLTFRFAWKAHLRGAIVHSPTHPLQVSSTSKPTRKAAVTEALRYLSRVLFVLLLLLSLDVACDCGSLPRRFSCLLRLLRTAATDTPRCYCFWLLLLINGTGRCNLTPLHILADTTIAQGRMRGCCQWWRGPLERPVRRQWVTSTHSRGPHVPPGVLGAFANVDLDFLGSVTSSTLGHHLLQLDQFGPKDASMMKAPPENGCNTFPAHMEQGVDHAEDPECNNEGEDGADNSACDSDSEEGVVIIGVTAAPRPERYDADRPAVLQLPEPPVFRPVTGVCNVQSETTYGSTDKTDNVYAVLDRVTVGNEFAYLVQWHDDNRRFVAA